MSSVESIIKLTSKPCEVTVNSKAIYTIEGDGEIRVVVEAGESVEIVDLSDSCSLEIVLGRSSCAKIVALKCLSSKNSYKAILNGEHSSMEFYGVAIARDEKKIDITTYFDHAASHSESNQRIKCIASDNAKTLFEGSVYIPKGVGDISAQQQNKNLLLSDTARIESHPWLEIYADDVKCSHGSTTGMLNEEEIFYMRQRGISLKNARKLQIESFAIDVLENITNEDVRKRAEELVVDIIDSI